MKIEEFKDGYCLTYKGKEYLYKGKTEDVVDMISKKVKQLLTTNTPQHEKIEEKS